MTTAVEQYKENGPAEAGPIEIVEGDLSWSGSFIRLDFMEEASES